MSAICKQCQSLFQNDSSAVNNYCPECLASGVTMPGQPQRSPSVAELVKRIEDLERRLKHVENGHNTPLSVFAKHHS